MKSLLRTLNKEQVELQESKMRIEKFLSHCGVCARRKAKDLIASLTVSINGVLCSDIVTLIDPRKDIIRVEDRVINYEDENKIYLVMNKPRGIMTSLHDPEGRKTVRELCPEIKERIFPVGRLDYLSEGLIILTNDGEMAQHIIHPTQNVVKTYEVKIFGHITPKVLDLLKKGTVDEDGNKLRPLSVRPLKILKNKSWLEFQLSEGRNREIRKICQSAQVTIDKLRRVAIGGLTITNIPPGKYVKVTKKALLKEIQGRYLSRMFKSTTKMKNPSKFKHFNSPQDEKHVKFRTEFYQGTMKSRKSI